MAGRGGGEKNVMLAQLMAGRGRGRGRGPPPPAAAVAKATPEAVATPEAAKKDSENIDFHGKPFVFDETQQAFLFAAHHTSTSNSSSSSSSSAWLENPCLIPDIKTQKHKDTDIMVPLAPCVYRMTDYTYAKKQPIELQRTILKLGVLRCLQRECETLNELLWNRLHPTNQTPTKKNQAGLSSLKMPIIEGTNSQYQNAGKATKTSKTQPTSSLSGTIEEDELGKTRFMELLSNCGVYQKVSELILQRAAKVVDHIKKHQDKDDNDDDDENPYCVPQVHVDGLNEFLDAVERHAPMLEQARTEIATTATVSFFPGLGELFCPGSKLTCYPDGMEGTPLGCQVVQCWYDQDVNPATQKIKRRFILVVEFIVSVGDELVFVAASDVYPEFHDANRNLPIKDLKHRKLNPAVNGADQILLERLQQRGEFYASVATKNHYLEYYPNSFFPIIGGGWSNNAVRPLTKGGRVMVDVKRGILEGHIPVRAISDGMSDTVKEAIKLFEQSKRTGVAVPFRTCILPGFDGLEWTMLEQGDRKYLWQSWPMLTGFSFTARVWGKLLLGMPKPPPTATSPLAAASGHKNSMDVSLSSATSRHQLDDDQHPHPTSPKRAASVKWGVKVGGLGGVGKCGNCGYITFHEQAFDQLVLAEDKKELIRAVARNAGGNLDDNDDADDDDDDDDDIGIDVVANKGGASIFLLSGEPGTGKTLTAEAIAELLKKPLYVVTAGDLGTDAAQVEKSLGSVLELCQTWDALVLIDEADIFLEARSSHEIQRNALVCVMLRLLEYYSGCLFLSSNRAKSSIDPAIASRITVMLSYPPLDEDGRAKVWRNLTGLVPKPPLDMDGKIPVSIANNPKRASKYRVDFTEDDYKQLAQDYPNLNGRQIKNSIVLARSLARERGTPMSLEILRRAVTAVAGE